MKTTIRRDYTFSAAHWLPDVERGHKCGRLHGHNYKVSLFVTGKLTKGMVMDFADIDTLAQPIMAMFDHNCLNDTLRNPTSENLAAFIMGELSKKGRTLKGLVAVEVSETDKSAARVERD